MPQGAIPFPFGDCKICCDKATGVHYGVATCEGCKGFFKRSIPKAEKYKCFFGGQCQLSPQNRNRCKACRFQRCLDMGMSMDAVKMGRIPKVDKERALEAHRGGPEGCPIDLPSLSDGPSGSSPSRFEDGLYVKQEPHLPSAQDNPHQRPSFREQLSDRSLAMEDHSSLTPISCALHTTTPLPAHAAQYSNMYATGQDGQPLSNQDSGYSDGNNSDGGSPKGGLSVTEHGGYPVGNTAANSMTDYKFLQDLDHQAAPSAGQSDYADHLLSSSHSSPRDRFHLEKSPHVGIGEPSFLSSLRESHYSHHPPHSHYAAAGSSAVTSSTETYSPAILKELLSQVITSGQGGQCQEQIGKYLSSVLPNQKELTQNLIAVLQSPQVLAELLPQIVASMTGKSPQSLKRRYSDPPCTKDRAEQHVCGGSLPNPPKVPTLDHRDLQRSVSIASNIKQEATSGLSELCNLVMEHSDTTQHPCFDKAVHTTTSNQKHQYRQLQKSMSLDETMSMATPVNTADSYTMQCKVKQERTSPTFSADCPGNKGNTLWDEVFKGTKAIYEEADSEDVFDKNTANDLSMKRPLSREQPTTGSDGGKGTASDRVEFPPPGGSADNESMIISTLSKLSETETLYCEKLRDDIESMLETMAGKRRMHELNYLSQATYRQVGVVWKSLFEDIASVNKMIISLCQAIPGFVKLDLTEQAKLMEDAYFDLWLLLFACLFRNNESYIRMNNNIHYTRFWMSHFLTDSLIEKMFNFCEQLNSCKLSRLEICVLCAVQLTHPDRSTKEEVRLLHSHFLDVLVYTIEKSHPVNHSRILVNLFRILPLLQAIQVEQAQVIGTFRAEKPPERCESMVVVGSIEEELARLEAEQAKTEEQEALDLQQSGKNNNFCDSGSRDSPTIEESFW